MRIRRSRCPTPRQTRPAVRETPARVSPRRRRTYHLIPDRPVRHDSGPFNGCQYLPEFFFYRIVPNPEVFSVVRLIQRYLFPHAENSGFLLHIKRIVSTSRYNLGVLVKNKPSVLGRS